ncbi:sec-independent translocase [Streptomyces sp. NPDC050161]|uniref:sec-independent translocase n=1 Tax=Streptomyces sp. NPDC050161 TaxID=3365604 RepID=UPI0037981982
MFLDIGLPELAALAILGVLIFGPDKLPKVIQDVASFIRKVRAFSDNAKEDIRSELGPEFKDFEFEDLKPQNFVRKHVLDKHVLDKDEYGLKDLQEIRDGFDLKKEMAEVTDAVKTAGEDPADAAHSGGRLNLSKESPAASGRIDLTKGGAAPAAREHPPFDADAT